MLKRLTFIFCLVIGMSPLWGQNLKPVWRQDGLLMKQPKEALELWDKVEEAAVKDPEAAGKMIIKIFEEIEKHTATDGGQKSKVLVSQKCDRWLEAFVAYWISSEDLSMPKKVIVLDALYRSPVSKWFSNMGLTIRSHMEIFSQFSGALEENSNEKPTPYAAVISKWSRGLNESQNATLAALTSRAISNNWSASKERLASSSQWIERTLAKRSEILADLSLPLVTFRAIRYRSKPYTGRLDQARSALVRLPLHPEFIPLLRLEVMDAWLQAGHAGKAFASAEHFNLLVDALIMENEPWRDRSMSPILDSTGVISEISFAGIQKPAARLVVAFKETLFKENDRLPRASEHLVRSRLELGKLAVAAEDMDFVVSVIEEKPEFFKADLKLMLKLASKGHAKVAASLASSSPEDYDSFTGVWITEKEVENLRALVAALPKESAYLTECVIASSHDHIDHPPTENNKLEARLLPLAKRFAAEAPKDDRTRIILLQGFLRSLAASTFLKDEYLKLLHSYDLKKALNMAGRSRFGHLDSIRLLECLSMAYGHQLGEGSVEPFRKELKKLCSDPDLKLQASRALHQLLPFLTTQALVHAVKGPKEAGELTGICRELFKESFSLPGSDDFLTGALAGFSLSIHALAGETKEWGAFVRDLPKENRDVYSAIRKREGVKGLFRLVGGTLPWRNGYLADVRQGVTDALLNDEWIYTREIKSINQIFYFSSVFGGKEHVVKTVNNLPEEHPNRAEYLAGIGVIYISMRNKDVEKFNQSFLKARKIADERGADEKYNLYVELHAYHTAKVKQYDKALNILKLFKEKVLEPHDQKRIDGYRKNWEARR